MGVEYIGKCVLIREKKKGREEKVLAVGDLHLGYEEALNKSGVYVTREMYKEMMREIGEILEKCGKIDKIILLGDVKHSFSGNLKQEWNDVLGFISYLKGKCEELVILRGNHDNYLGNIARKGEIEVVESYVFGEYCFVHGDKEYDEMYDGKIKYWIMGHAHPAIVLDDGNKREKYKCFLAGKWKGKEVIIVPSFFSLVIGSDIREKLNVPWKFNINNFSIKVVNGMDVFDFGKVGKN